MTATIINGKALAQNLLNQVAEQIKTKQLTPKLSIILVGNDPASELYVAAKQQAGRQVGIEVDIKHLSSNTTETELLNLIQQLNHDPQIDGILLQLPLPQQLDSLSAIKAIGPHKDVDGLHPNNLGLLAAQDKPHFLACTPKGIMLILGDIADSLQGKHAVIIGAYNIVGRPLALALLNQNATVTICHRHTENLQELSQQADILISATGQSNLITADWVKSGAIVIDVGINQTADGKICGDVDFNNVQNVAGWITPVPGGVGPMTVACLMKNTLLAAEQRGDKHE